MQPREHFSWYTFFLNPDSKLFSTDNCCNDNDYSSKKRNDKIIDNDNDNDINSDSDINKNNNKKW